jgi:hypothetical protein
LGGYNAYGYTKAVAEREILAGIEDGQWACIVNPGAIVGKYDISGYARIGRMVIIREGLTKMIDCNVFGS